MVEVFFILFFLVILAIFGCAAIKDFFSWLRRK